MNITVVKGMLTGGQNGVVYFDTEDNIRGRRDHITDENGKTIKFNNIASIISYVSRRGWNYVDSWTNFLEDNEVHLLFRRIKNVGDRQK
jgi:hypothetical protein